MKKVLSLLFAELLITTACFTASAASVPSKYSAVEKGLVTPVKTQGNYGSCAAFAAVSCMESDYIKQGYGTADNTDFSEAYLFWYAVNSLWNDEKSGYNGDGVSVISNTYMEGASDIDLFSALKTDSGIAYEYDFPYSPYDASRMGYYTDAERFASGCNVRIKDIVELDVSDRNDVKDWILKHGSAAVAFNGTRFYEGSNGTVARNNLALINNHEATIVGWDDDFIAQGLFSSFVMKEKGAWLVKNSWGEEWGDNGYFWLPYSDPTISTIMGFTVTVNNDCAVKYSYNGYAAYFYGREVPVKGANLFTAEQSGTISKVAFYVYKDTDITVGGYSDNGDGIPDSGKRLAGFKGHYDDEGYYTVSLSSPAKIAKGQKFYVVGEYSNNCPLENTAFTSGAPEQSFTFIDGEWHDTSEDRFVNNVALDAVITGKHSFGPVQHKDSGCNTAGYDMRVCEHCGKVERTIIRPQGHIYSEWKLTGVGRSAGITVWERTCSVCGEREIQYRNREGEVISLFEAEELIENSSVFASLFDNATASFYTFVNLIHDIFRTGFFRLLTL